MTRCLALPPSGFFQLTHSSTLFVASLREAIDYGGPRPRSLYHSRRDSNTQKLPFILWCAILATGGARPEPNWELSVGSTRILAGVPQIGTCHYRQLYTATMHLDAICVESEPCAIGRLSHHAAGCDFA